MNIAIIISSLTGGGAERIAQIVGNYYVDQGDTVYYFILNRQITQDYAVKGKIIYADIDLNAGRSHAQKMIRLLLSSLKIRVLKFKYKIDAAVSFMEDANYLNVLSKGRELVITRVCHTLSAYETLYPKSFYYKKNIVSFFYKKADKVIVLSDDGYHEMRSRYGIPGSRLIKIPNISNGITNVNDGREWEYGDKVLICAGRLFFIKQQERIIRAFSYAHQKEPDATLIILGKGPQLRYLKHLCRKCAVQDHVLFLGFTDEPTWYFSHARAYVIASKTEGFSNAMVEAMGCGTPVITTDSPGSCGEIVGKPKGMGKANTMMLCRYGILTPDMPMDQLNEKSPLCEEETLLGEAMLAILTNEDLYQKYRKASLNRAEMFCFDKVIKKWNIILKD